MHVPHGTELTKHEREAIVEPWSGVSLADGILVDPLSSS